MASSKAATGKTAMFNAEVEKKIIELLEAGKPRNELALAAGVHEVRLGGWLAHGRKHPRGPYGKIAKVADRVAREKKKRWLEEKHAAKIAKRAELMKRVKANLKAIEKRLVVKRRALATLQKADQRERKKARKVMRAIK